MFSEDIVDISIKPGSHLCDKHDTSDISISISTRKKEHVPFFLKRNTRKKEHVPFFLCLCLCLCLSLMLIAQV